MNERRRYTIEEEREQIKDVVEYLVRGNGEESDSYAFIRDVWTNPKHEARLFPSSKNAVRNAVAVVMTAETEADLVAEAKQYALRRARIADQGGAENLVQEERRRAIGESLQEIIDLQSTSSDSPRLALRRSVGATLARLALASDFNDPIGDFTERLGFVSGLTELFVIDVYNLTKRRKPSKPEQPVTTASKATPRRPSLRNHPW